jgi:hypothetical protein
MVPPRASLAQRRARVIRLASRPAQPASGLAGVRTEAATAGRAISSATIARMAVTDDRPVAEQLSELGAQLAWVRDYL